MQKVKKDKRICSRLTALTTKSEERSSEQIRVLKKLKMQKVKKGQTDLFAPDGSHHKKRRTLVLSKSVC